MSKIIDLVDLGLSNHREPKDLAKKLKCPVEIRVLGKMGDVDFCSALEHTNAHCTVSCRKFMAFHDVSNTEADGTVWTHTSATGGAGTCHVRPTRAVVTVINFGGWTHCNLWVQGEVLNSESMFPPGAVDQFLSDMDKNGRAMGAPVD